MDRKIGVSFIVPSLLLAGVCISTVAIIEQLYPWRVEMPVCDLELVI